MSVRTLQGVEQSLVCPITSEVCASSVVGRFLSFFSSLTDGVARLPSPQLFVDPGLGLVLRLAEFFYVV